MKHLSLAARYRPQTFAEVAGQEMVVAALSRAAAASAPAPAYLLSGTRGVGKTTIARIFAKALNCERGPAAEPCNECPQCVRITRGVHVDVTEIDGASNNSVEDARALREHVGYAPMEGRYKVFIVDEAHMLSRSAFNALLKTLEEPPERVVFIFATTEAHRFPVTIVSRCQHFVFRHLGEDALAAHLVKTLRAESVQYDDSAVRLLARRAAGSVRDAMSLLDQALALGGERLDAETTRQVLGLAGRELFTQLFTALAARDCATTADIARRILGQGVDIGFFTRELAAHWRALFLLAQTGGAAAPVLRLPEDETAWLKGVAASFAPAHLHAAWQMTLDAQRGITQSPEPAAALELLLLNLALLPCLVPLDRLGSAGAQPAAAAAPAPAAARAATPATPEASAPPRSSGTASVADAGQPGVVVDAAPAAGPAEVVPAEARPAEAVPEVSGPEASGPEAFGPEASGRAVSAPPEARCPQDSGGEDGTRQVERLEEEAPAQNADSGAEPRAARPHTERPDAEAPARAGDWAAFRDFCAAEHAAGRDAPPLHVLRGLDAVWAADGVRLRAPSRELLHQLERQRPALEAALSRFCGGSAPRLELCAPTPPRTRSDLAAEFAQKPELRACFELLGATVQRCTEYRTPSTHNTEQS